MNCAVARKHDEVEITPPRNWQKDSDRPGRICAFVLTKKLINSNLVGCARARMLNDLQKNKSCNFISLKK